MGALKRVLKIAIALYIFESIVDRPFEYRRSKEAYEFLDLCQETLVWVSDEVVEHPDEFSNDFITQLGEKISFLSTVKTSARYHRIAKED